MLDALPDTHIMNKSTKMHRSSMPIQVLTEQALNHFYAAIESVILFVSYTII